jgi:hypothetical protein
MELSLIQNEKCFFTGKKEKYLIGLGGPEGTKIYLSRECFDIGLKVLNAIDPVEPIAPIAPQNQLIHREPVHQEQAQPVSRPPAFVKASQKKAVQGFDMKKAETFLKELEHQQKEYAEEHEGKEAGFSGLIIKRAIKNVAHLVDKEVMYTVLKKVIGMDRDRFEIDYSHALKVEDNHGDE